MKKMYGSGRHGMKCAYVHERKTFDGDDDNVFMGDKTLALSMFDNQRKCITKKIKIGFMMNKSAINEYGVNPNLFSSYLCYPFAPFSFAQTFAYLYGVEMLFVYPCTTRGFL